jgi:hypothetical protein
MNLGGLYRIRGKGIQKLCTIDRYRLHPCNDHRWNAWKGCQYIVFCANNEVCDFVNTELISPKIFRFPCNQLLTSFVSILSLVNIDISGRIESFQHLIKYLLGRQRRRFAFILLWDDIDHLTLRIKELHCHMSWLSCCDSFFKGSLEGIYSWLLAYCFAGWLPKRLVIGFWNIISTIIVIVGYHTGIVIKIIVVDRSSTSPGKKMNRRSICAAPSCDD